MNAYGRQLEVHYIDTGFPYTVTQSFMDLFEGLQYAQADVALTEALQDQGNPYWSMMHASSYKYGFYAPANNTYYSSGHAYETIDYVPRLDGGRRVWNHPAALSNSAELNLQHEAVNGIRNAESIANPSNEECIRTSDNLDTSSPEHALWQDDLDLDNMTYEELLDLGETVGTQNRGLSEDKISLLPVTKYKCKLFSRKKSRRERCVICQMEYKRGDHQMTLPCKHIYHSCCVSKWLSINKACPVCFAEVFAEEPSKH